MSTFDFEAAVQAPFRMQPGLRRVRPGAPQLHALDPRGAVFAQKLAALATAPDDAVCMVDASDVQEALQALATEAALQCPDAVVNDDGTVTAPALGWQVELNGVLNVGGTPHAAAGACLARLPAPLRLAGLLALALHEDFALVDGATGTLPLLAVCLPSHWSPRARLGRHFTEVHAPVADNALLLAAAEGLLRLACGAERWERFVWTVTPQPRHDAHPARHPRPAWALRDDAALLAQAHWRTERQSFLPLPARRQAWFLIEVHVTPLAEAIDTPARAAALHAAIASMSPAVLAYRGLEPARAPLLRWLAARGAA